VQIIFAGKAHPHDTEGKELIRQIVQVSHQERFRHRIVFIEDYDMQVARHLVQGADVWMNTPRRPMEASGTSGMKVAFNGGLNLSILDGWWCEGYQGNNGWAIGKGEVYADLEYQNQVESGALYDLLEKEVVPLFYQSAADGIPRDWVTMVKSSMQSLCPVFSTDRMVEEYAQLFYIPSCQQWSKLEADDLAWPGSCPAGSNGFSASGPRCVLWILKPLLVTLWRWAAACRCGLRSFWGIFCPMRYW